MKTTRKRKRLFAIAAAGFLMGACGPTTVWVKKGVTDEQIAQDRNECTRKTGGRELRAGESSQYFISDNLTERMEAKERVRKAGLFMTCMRRKGYKRVTQ